MCVPCAKEIINQETAADLDHGQRYAEILEGVFDRFENGKLPGVTEESLGAWADEAMQIDEAMRTAAAAYAAAYDKLLHRITRALRKAA